MTPWLNLDRERWAPSAIRIADNICIVMVGTGGVMCLASLIVSNCSSFLWATQVATSLHFPRGR